MVRTATGTLTAEQIAQFERDGFLIVRQMFQPDEIDLIRDTFMDVVRDGPVEGLSDVGRITDRNDPLWRYGRLMHPHLNATGAPRDVAMRYMLDPRVHDVLADLYGEEPLAAQSMFYFKPPGARGQDLHQDNFYLRIHPGTCMAAWVAVDDADRENGGLVAVPGSHKLDVVCPEDNSDPTRFFTGHHVAVPEGLHEEPADMKAGDVLFFNGSVIHGSYPNTSSSRFRRSFICHYGPASCEERAEHYKFFNFEGDRVQRGVAEGGGPCGDVNAAAMGPH